ncbi:DUF2867 domain-containing protein [Streptomyces sp. NPDC094438]|uniref:DUF2867 domain-containing protein n=1 Tax=Streptomyces sp. NPDC094438 TaxID=3366061 RepID=UPI00380292EF
MRLPNAAHAAQPWMIHDMADDFTLQDVWALRTPGGPGDLPLLVRTFTSWQPGPAVRTLLAVRLRIGGLLGLDDPGSGVGARVPSLRDRVPADLRDGPSGPGFGAFTCVYQTEQEWAAELANRTVHAVMHIGWVPDGAGGYRGQTAVLAKPNALPGKAYMAGIKPFRRLLVEPALVRAVERRWQARETAVGEP